MPIIFSYQFISLLIAVSLCPYKTKRQNKFSPPKKNTRRKGGCFFISLKQRDCILVSHNLWLGWLCQSAPPFAKRRNVSHSRYFIALIRRTGVFFCTLCFAQYKKVYLTVYLFILVGIAGFEPTTFRPPDERATRLRYIPKQICLYAKKNKKARFFFVFLKKKQAMRAGCGQSAVFLLYIKTKNR